MSDVPHMPYFVGIDPAGKDHAAFSIVRQTRDGTFEVVAAGVTPRKPPIIDLTRDQWSVEK